MNKLVLKNKAIVPVFTFLTDVKLKGKASRGRTTMTKRLQEKQDEYNEGLIELKKEYFEVDAEGELIVKEDQYVPKNGADEKELKKRVKELDEEEFEIHFGEYATKYKAMFEVLEDHDEELNGQMAYGFNEVMEAYEANEDTNGEEK